MVLKKNVYDDILRLINIVQNMTVKSPITPKWQTKKISKPYWFYIHQVLQKSYFNTFIFYSSILDFSYSKALVQYI